VSRAQIAQILH